MKHILQQLSQLEKKRNEINWVYYQWNALHLNDANCAKCEVYSSAIHMKPKLPTHHQPLPTLPPHSLHNFLELFWSLLGASQFHITHAFNHALQECRTILRSGLKWVIPISNHQWNSQGFWFYGSQNSRKLPHGSYWDATKSIDSPEVTCSKLKMMDSQGKFPSNGWLVAVQLQTHIVVYTCLYIFS